MKNTGIRIVALLILQTLCLETSHSADAGSPKFNEALLKQEKIYQSEDEKELENYIVDRSLLNYGEALPSKFDRTLANLGPEDRWLDIGAGKGYAILDYYSPDYDLTRLEGRERRGKKARAVAISIEDRRSVVWRLKTASLEPNQIQYLFNRRLQEYSLEELGQFQLITDVIGGFAYTENLTLFLEKVLGFLELNGSFYTLLQDVHFEDGTNRPFYAGSPFLTEIANASGSEVRVCSWLKSISCVEVTCEVKAGWQPPVEAYSIRKVCNDVTVPALVPLHYEAGTPPERRFQLRN